MAQVYASAGILAARAAGESPEMDAVADQVADAARTIAAAHNLTGGYAAGIGTERIRGKRGVVDRIAFVDHPAATFIEWGHMTRTGRSDDAARPRWVEGLHIWGRAVAEW